MYSSMAEPDKPVGIIRVITLISRWRAVNFEVLTEDDAKIDSKSLHAVWIATLSLIGCSVK